jgi:two-component system response regulator PrrA
MNILLASGNEDLLQFLERALEFAGCHVRGAVTGSRALTLSRSRRTPTDVLVSDLELSDMSGVELCAAVRRERPGTGVLLIGDARPEHLPAGARFLQKPFTHLELLAEARRTIGPDALAAGAPFPAH